jgi:curved DNA-binding protein CbpA
MGDGQKTFYEILGVQSGASQSDISKAFRLLVKEGHPDRFQEPGEKAAAETRLKQITEAYNTLGKPRLRLEYDRSLVAAPQATAVTRSPQEQAKDLLAQGKAKYRANDLQSALAVFDHMLRLEPENPEALFFAGMVRLRNPHWRNQGALQVEKAIDLAPYEPAFVSQYGALLLEIGQKIRALKVLEAASLRFKDDQAIQELLALARGEKPGGFTLFGKRK